MKSRGIRFNRCLAALLRFGPYDLDVGGAMGGERPLPPPIRARSIIGSKSRRRIGASETSVAPCLATGAVRKRCRAHRPQKREATPVTPPSRPVPSTDGPAHRSCWLRPYCAGLNFNSAFVCGLKCLAPPPRVEFRCRES
ncbi:hypothetical protein EVAR_103845_1 [Eumeta japonica]|uniref:Uncharacterized protein n=1 Tax=Eumeta variegata TaxID=151549 RepID=A0A4C2ABX5_EUMVA|nr:hypothetical protein EVAR_103845_1 [Eumeta japonica]